MIDQNPGRQFSWHCLVRCQFDTFWKESVYQRIKLASVTSPLGAQQNCRVLQLDLTGFGPLLSGRLPAERLRFLVDEDLLRMDAYLRRV